MNFESTVSHNSKLPGFEGVKFCLKKMTEGRRIKLRLALAAAQAELMDVLTEASNAKDNEVKLAGLLNQVESIRGNTIDPLYVRWGVKSIEGLQIDGQDATVDLLIEEGPPELYQEILSRVKKEAGLSDEEKGESVPPTTSNAATDGRTETTTAGSVGNLA